MTVPKSVAATIRNTNTIAERTLGIGSTSSEVDDALGGWYGFSVMVSATLSAHKLFTTDRTDITDTPTRPATTLKTRSKSFHQFGEVSTDFNSNSISEIHDIRGRS